MDTGGHRGGKGPWPPKWWNFDIFFKQNTVFTIVPELAPKRRYCDRPCSRGYKVLFQRRGIGGSRTVRRGALEQTKLLKVVFLICFLLKSAKSGQVLHFWAPEAAVSDAPGVQWKRVLQCRSLAPERNTRIKYDSSTIFLFTYLAFHGKHIRSGHIRTLASQIWMRWCLDLMGTTEDACESSLISGRGISHPRSHNTGMMWCFLCHFPDKSMRNLVKVYIF